MSPERLKYHREYMRFWRRTHPLSDQQILRDIVRSYAGVYKRRGHLVAEECIVCGNPETEMHHPDYARPLQVKWMCREHHLALERLKRRCEVNSC